MALKINPELTAATLAGSVRRVFDLSASKIADLEKRWDPRRGSPVFTIQGEYTSRGWTEWTQGFQYGSALLQYDATGDAQFLEIGRGGTRRVMAPHVSHMGVHDHGFNNISTYGNLWRLMREGRIPPNEQENDFLELALKVSGAVQAARWSDAEKGDGYIYSFNGPHSMFVDTVRSLRSLAVSHQLGHALMGERDRRISLLERLLIHARTTARYNLFYGEGRDSYDVPGRTSHESIFNCNDGSFRCPSSQQGYSPFSTWTRGLAWAILGFSEQLEFLCSIKDGLPVAEQEVVSAHLEQFLRAARVTADFYIKNSCHDGIPAWDTGAPGLVMLGDYLDRRSDPCNPHEPVDSSAAAIAAQGFLRLGAHMGRIGMPEASVMYRQAGLTVAETLFSDSYLSADPSHQGLIVHSVYHRPNGWDAVRAGQAVPNGESSMWGDYHARELALMILRESEGKSWPRFFGPAAADCRFLPG